MKKVYQTVSDCLVQLSGHKGIFGLGVYVCEM